MRGHVWGWGGGEEGRRGHVFVCAKRGGGWCGAEDVKAMSNGGTKKRIFSSSPVTCRSPDLFGPKERCGRKEQRMGVGGFGGWVEGGAGVREGASVCVGDRGCRRTSGPCPTVAPSSNPRTSQ